MLQRRLKKAFTLIELLLVIGIIAVLANIIILAINPRSQLQKAQDAKRTSEVREIKNAIHQYQIDHGFIPDSITTTTMLICRYGITNVGCVNLDVLVDEDYVTGLEVDPLETNVNTTGYTVNQGAGGFIEVRFGYVWPL